MSSPAPDDPVASVERWWHSIDLPDGVVTPGHKTPEILAQELERLRLPDLRGKRVLDIGAWDGYFSFACERLGAAEVVALDHYVWSMDLVGYEEYRQRCMASGEPMRAPHEVPDFWVPDRLPGKAGFDTARTLLASRVRPVVGDFMEMDLEPLGQFDAVLYLGVIYHVEDPMRALRRLASVTREVAVIETEAMHLPAHPDASLAAFHPFGELNDDVTNWWVPTFRALADMCRAAGFDEVEATTPPPRPARGPRLRRAGSRKDPVHYRLVVQARKHAPTRGEAPRGT